MFQSLAPSPSFTVASLLCFTHSTSTSLSPNSGLTLHLSALDDLWCFPVPWRQLAEEAESWTRMGQLVQHYVDPWAAHGSEIWDHRLAGGATL